MADSLHQLCRENIQQDNQHFLRYRELQRKFSDEGISKDEWALMDLNKDKADREIKGLNLELLNTIKSNKTPAESAHWTFLNQATSTMQTQRLPAKKVASS
jgi:hypothetical protein